MSSFETIKKDNLSNSVYQAIRNALIDGQYQPGDRLKINEIAAQMGVSITPVREAIFRLVSNQSLSMRAATAIYVPLLTPERLIEIQKIRHLLEGEAAAQAALKITDEKLTDLFNIQTEFQQTVNTDSRKAAELNRLFHFGVIEAANSPLITKTLENMWVMMGPLLRKFHLEVPRQELVSDKHRHFDVLNALKKHDPEAARTAMQNDIAWGKQMIEWLKEEQDSATTAESC